MKHINKIGVVIFAIIFILVGNTVLAAQDWNSSRSNKTSKTSSVPPNPQIFDEETDEKSVSGTNDDDCCKEEEYISVTSVGEGESGDVPAPQQDQIKAPGFKAGKALKEVMVQSPKITENVSTPPDEWLDSDRDTKSQGDTHIDEWLDSDRDIKTKEQNNDSNNEGVESNKKEERIEPEGLGGLAAGFAEFTKDEQQNVWFDLDQPKQIVEQEHAYQIKSVKKNEDTTISLKGEENIKLFWFIPIKMPVEITLNENEFVQEISKPWYSFLFAK